MTTLEFPFDDISDARSPIQVIVIDPTRGTVERNDASRVLPPDKLRRPRLAHSHSFPNGDVLMVLTRLDRETGFSIGGSAVDGVAVVVGRKRGGSITSARSSIDIVSQLVRFK